MQSLKFLNFHVGVSSYCRTCQRQLLTSLFVMQSEGPVKRKWKTSEIETLLEWRRVTDEVFGPVVNVNNVKTGQRSKIQKITNQFDELNRTFSASLVTFDANFRDTIPSQQLSDDDSLTFLNSNFSELKQVPSTQHENGRSYSRQGVSPQTMHAVVPEKSRDKSQFKKNQVKEDGKHQSPGSEVSDTFDYKWEDQPPEKTVDLTNGMAMIEKSISKNVLDATPNGVCSRSKLSTKLHSGINDSHLGNSVNFEHPKYNDKCETSIGIEVGNLSPVLEEVKDGLQSIDNENFIMSFPLFLTDSHKKAPIEDSKIAVGRVPSVTRILQATQSPESRKILEKWEKLMIAGLGEAGFAKYKADTFANGTNLHTNIELFLTGRSDEIQIREGNEGHWQSIEPLLDYVTGVRFVEHPVRHEGLKYAGIIDCVAEFRGSPCIIEWKTSQRRKTNLKSTFDNPLQLAAYLGAYNSQLANSPQLEECVLVIGYGDGNAADVHVMKRKDCVQYWNAWLTRLNQYHGMSKITRS